MIFGADLSSRIIWYEKDFKKRNLKANLDAQNYRPSPFPHLPRLVMIQFCINQSGTIFHLYCNDMQFHNLDPSIQGFNHLWEIPPPLFTYEALLIIFTGGLTDVPFFTLTAILFQHDYLYLYTILIPPPYHVNWAPYQEENTIAAPNSNYFTDYSHFVLSDIRLTKGGNIPEMLTKTNLSSSL